MTSRIVTEVRSSYNGPGEVWVNDAQFKASITLRLTLFEDMHETGTNQGVMRTEGLISWGGKIIGLTEAEMFRLAQANDALELRLPNGRTGTAFLIDTDGSLRGSGTVPFD